MVQGDGRAVARFYYNRHSRIAIRRDAQPGVRQDLMCLP